MNKQKMLSSVPVTAIILMLACNASFGQSLSEIQDSIRAKGRKWIAAENSVSILPDNEKRLRVGLIKRPPTSGERVLSGQTPQQGLPASYSVPSSDVTPVRDQESCSSCWAFATTAALESNLLIRGAFLPGTDDARAEQILLSCSGAGSCSGGSIGSASSFIQSTGLPPYSDFPYTATNNACGNATPGWQASALNISSWAYVTTNTVDVDTIKTALVAYGPLATTMDVYTDFFSYSNGTYEYTTGTLAGSHAILIVGYEDNASSGGGGYFTVKNSWGTGWGMAGYFQIAYSQVNAPVNFGEYTIAYLTAAPASPPAPPTQLRITVASAGDVNLSWTSGSTN